MTHFSVPDFKQGSKEPCLGFGFSKWLGEALEKRLSAVSGWHEARPVALGSWARDELCPKSDIDMIFCGPEDVVQQVVGKIQVGGLRIRARVPQDPEDWTVGVEPFDILAVQNGRAFAPETAEILRVQQERIKKRGDSFARSLLLAIKKEKNARRVRFDSVANYLEPNIKYGPGGLRDLEQAMAIRQLFTSQFLDSDPAWANFKKYKELWLAIRQWLHLHGGGDLLSGPEQPQLAEGFGFKDYRNFMGEFQKGISTVNFFAEWAVEMAEMKRARRPSRAKLATYADAFRAMERNPSFITMAKVREAIPHLRGEVELAKFFKPQQKEQWFEALFESHLIDRCLKDVSRIRGLVQHDHYHRFTADAHLLQAIREVIRLKRRPKSIGRLAPSVRKLTANDWQILLWTALFHDLAKGMGGDHSQKGGQMAERELSRLGVAKEVIEEVKWMVVHHLELSTAAFRMNVQDPQTWQKLSSVGATGIRLERLAIFTALDIRATNPEAWNEWKERLLSDLLTAMASSTAHGFINFLRGAGNKLAAELASEIDPAVALAVPNSKLLLDVRKACRAKKDLPPLAIRNRRRETWVRFHSHKDRPGLFLEYVAKLFAMGCSIQQSSIRTGSKVGVYDWFQVRTTKRPQQLLKQLDLIKDWTRIDPPLVKLQKIEVVSDSNQEVIFSFRGRDQKGVLLATAKALFDLGYTVRWAKVITWGAQIDDIFSVQGGPQTDEALLRLKKIFGIKESASAEVEKIEAASV